MTIAISRPAALLAAAAAGLLLAGCGAQPSQVGSAAIVGDNVITLDTVQHELDTVLNDQAQAKAAQQQGSLDAVSRNILRAQVLHQLVLRVQQQDGIAVNAQQVNQLVEQAGGADAAASQLLVDPAAVDDVAHDQLVEEQLARRYVDRLSVTFDYVVANTRADAVSEANRIAADPSVMAGLMSSAANSGGQGLAGSGVRLSLGQALQSSLSAAQQSVTESFAPLFGVSANTVVAFQPATQSGAAWMVALVHQRTLSASAAASGIADSVGSQELAAAGVSLLEPIAAQLGVRVSPRYGVWDSVGMTVVASTDQAAGVTVGVRTVRS